MRGAGRGALPRDRRCTSRKDEHGPPGDHASRIAEPEKTILRRATPVARERAPTGAVICDSRCIIKNQKDLFDVIKKEIYVNEYDLACTIRKRMILVRVR